MAKTKEFFNILHAHSEAKLNILDEYVVTWMRKIALGPFGEKALVIDGFSGTGVYDNNKHGSPIRLLKHAMNFCEQAEKHGWPAPKLMFLFIEGFDDNYDELLSNIYKLTRLDLTGEAGFERLPGFPSIEVSCQNGSFEDVLESLLGELKSGYTLIPSFCFIDPFGFKDTPFDLIARYLKNPKSEILLNFIYEETNRFIRAKDPKIQAHMKKHFGVNDLNELTELVSDKEAALRKEIVVDFYSRQLMENTDVKYVLTFEIKKSGRTKLILFYGTKNIKGIKVMKKAMWKVDDTGLYMYDDRKPLQDIRFAFTKEIEDEIMIGDLANQIFEYYTGSRAYIEEIEEFVLTDTIFPIEVYAKKALVKLEKEGKFKEVRNRKNKNTYPKNTIINFN
ncbi:three-Cys-motif partner protein TcmP [Peribacillus simplex]|uniref:three-Cys-motif partner protein TcmP n=1 Tax=Peribacillus simplex TaxID=1478 RepID=UPI0034E8C926